MKIARAILCGLIVVCLLASVGFYIGYLTKQIDTLTQEKETAIADWQSTHESLEEMREVLNHTKELLTQATETIESQTIEIEHYKQEIADEEAKWRQRYEEYPVATEVWIAMKNQGWSDTVCAGIMGNLMAETGGTGTLQLYWKSNGENGYGLVQWIGGRRSAIKEKYGTYPTVKEQVQFIADELYGTNGVRVQVTDSQRDKIMNAETPEECAYAFACYYERCHESVRSMRRGFARSAYEYFTS